MERSAHNKPFNLFVYGTLMNPSVFRAVIGKRLVMLAGDADGFETVWAREALLSGYKRISPDSTYHYAVPDATGFIRGYLIGPLPAEAMAALRKYEGRNYSRKTVRVQTAEGSTRAVAFIGDLKAMEHSFGYEFHDPFKQEVLLKEKIGAALLEAEKEQLQTSDPLNRRALAELHGSIIRDLFRQHFDAGGIGDYAIRRSLRDVPLPNFARIAGDAEARALAPHYLSMVIRQVVLNEIEERIYQEFRYELDHISPGSEFYDRTLSCLSALRLLNDRLEQMEALVAACLAELSFPARGLVEYVRWAIGAADALYDAQAARQEIHNIRTHMGRGCVPLGAELEFSNIGHGVILDPRGQRLCDLRYDGFLYFTDFALDVLTWKLGGHIDDHYTKTSHAPRRGFFELALGSLSLEAGLSKPVTDDPWVLNQLIHHCRRFYLIAPHSLHVTLQIQSRRKPVLDRPLPGSLMRCLFALAGDPTRDESGALRINRLVGQEIARDDEAPHMLFSEVSLRHSTGVEDTTATVGSLRGSGRYVQQFKFLRLSPHLDYEPIIMALVGLQMSLAPGTFLTASQYEASARHRKLYHELMEWGSRPRPIAAGEVETFLGYVYDGLMVAQAGRGELSKAYIAWSLSQLRDMLRTFNQMAE
ncbi:MAG: gamma-glutamylcyclotransferase family protein [Phycisphaerae bacterium]|jgi:gamma-glutamylcyclotransferase (GGCT)/AIG2-like uncharacterized protein YtfP